MIHFKTVLLLCAFATFGLNLAMAAEPVDPVVKDWTIAVFLNGDNNLDSFGTADMKEMEQVGSNEHVNVVVLRDTANIKTTSKIYYVGKGSSQVVKDYGSNIDMGDYNRLVEFFQYVKDNYPAKHYLVDIWNHGAGWKLKTSVEPVRGISYDDNSGNHITTPQLGIAFAQMKAILGGKNIDVFGMDACLMEMAEVAYEVADSVDYMVGSEQTEPGDGWAYGEVLKSLVAKAEMDAKEFAVTVEREYTKSYNGGVQGKQDVQGSVVSPALLVAATGKLNELTSYMTSIAPAFHESFVQAMNKTQQYAYNDYKDFIHFITLAKGNVKDQKFQTLADSAIAALREAIIVNYVVGESVKFSTGLSVWIPTQYIYEGKQKEYEALKWSKEVGWNAFLVKMLLPSTPLISYIDISSTDENMDGFAMAGERVKFTVDLHNESPIAADGAILRMTIPEGLSVEVGDVKLDHFPKGSMSVKGLSAIVGKDTPPGVYTVTMALEVPMVGVIQKDYKVTVDGKYTFEPVSISSPHPYVGNANLKWQISKPGVAGMRIHFSKFETETRFDFVSIYDAAGKLLVKLDGRKDPFWSPFFAVDALTVQFTSDGVVNKYGFDIDKVAY